MASHESHEERDAPRQESQQEKVEDVPSQASFERPPEEVKPSESQAPEPREQSRDNSPDKGESESEEGEAKEEKGKRKDEEAPAEEEQEETAPPLPDEELPPPLPDEPLPGQEPEDDGWEPVWDGTYQRYYFYNRLTGLTQWENPRLPVGETAAGAEAGAAAAAATTTSTTTTNAHEDPSVVPAAPVAGGYNPAIHGDYDPTAPYAQRQEEAEDPTAVPGDPSMLYAATGSFNRFTGRWQPGDLGPERFTEDNRSKRHLNAFFDVDAAANTHDGRSLKAERSAKRLSKKELKAFREKRRERKEEKRRAWLRE